MVLQRCSNEIDDRRTRSLPCSATGDSWDHAVRRYRRLGMERAFPLFLRGRGNEVVLREKGRRTLIDPGRGQKETQRVNNNSSQGFLLWKPLNSPLSSLCSVLFFSPTIVVAGIRESPKNTVFLPTPKSQKCSLTHKGVPHTLAELCTTQWMLEPRSLRTPNPTFVRRIRKATE